MTEHIVRERHFQNMIRASFILFVFLCSLLLMIHTFSYDDRLLSPTVASKAWSDFGAHIPLIRSFSLGENFNRLFKGGFIESPLFPNEPIRYHFGFYALVGLLERLGVRIDWALNLPSAVGMTLLIVMTYALSFRLIQNRAVSLLSVIFMLFNGSLSFVHFFQIHPLSLHTITDIITNTKFASFGPWDGSLVSAFWTLNIYTNQRHLALAYGLSLCILWIILSTNILTKKYSKSVIIGSLMSVLLFVHFPAAVMTTICLSWIFLREKHARTSLMFAALLALPAFLFLLIKTHVGSPVSLDYGYLIPKPTTAGSFIQYWFYNIGLHMLFIPLGIVLAPSRTRRILLIPLFAIFVIPNIFRLSTDMINNHKFFNFFMIIGSMYSAYAIVRMWSTTIGKCVAIFAVILLTLSGVIDLFPVLNDTRGAIEYQGKHQDILFFQTQTNPQDIVANSSWFYHPASLSGRPIFSGYTYFTWSYGYDQGAREQTLLSVYRAQNIETLCPILQTNAISYIELSDKPEDYIQPNLYLWNNLEPVYKNSQTGLRIFKTIALCENR